MGSSPPKDAKNTSPQLSNSLTTPNVSLLGSVPSLNSSTWKMIPLSQMNPLSQATAMQNLLSRIKEEPDTSFDSPESNRWWAADPNSANPDLNANASSSDPTANGLARLTLPYDRTPGHKDPNKSVSFILPTPPKKKKTRKRKISPEFI